MTRSYLGVAGLCVIRVIRRNSPDDSEVGRLLVRTDRRIKKNGFEAAVFCTAHQRRPWCWPQRDARAVRPSHEGAASFGVADPPASAKRFILSDPSQGLRPVCGQPQPSPMRGELSCCRGDGLWTLPPTNRRARPKCGPRPETWSTIDHRKPNKTTVS